ncbi:4-diphosphocytidyl-2C-methyl-D-erythritol kinase [Intrasporangium oryzae NRRL B-24470]|uniref:4-diphosphocytidyl-2-C-methyl-D-erythritol kinase n=1 Tax=Intrasporangium oryzae NRRL B-24470 TaxID=1386089 RepID=W9G605_9MICO|nr:4-(cytidine 5'-diphospho)-2-C-methyl-D-erythritol kinase [Intrasporangium oryzae]EWT01581.1 4-diphosphocytidyl-2C-methyl-D-erythritol kinase [Intrasporangium oryzae NRRL B-24470]
MTVAPTLPGTVTVRAPAKVNLELRVGPRRADGYHDLATVFQAVSLHDEVSVARWDDWQVVAAGTYADLIPTGPDNLVVRAAQLLAQRYGIDETLSIRIDKDIPVAGGMAGGSADAAAALLACDELWGLGLDRDELSDLAAQLGSDVPFPLAGGNAMGSGRGEQLAPVLARGTFHWVFAVSDQGLSTPAVYAECDRLREAEGGDASVPEPRVSAEMMGALRRGDARELGRALHNDLEPAAFSLRPDLRELRDAGVEFGALGGVVSGSGPTVAFLTESHEASLDLSVSLAAADLCRDLRRAKGPVHGAHVITSPRGD